MQTKSSDFSGGMRTFGRDVKDGLYGQRKREQEEDEKKTESNLKSMAA
jgi:hypothetical protein